MLIELIAAVCAGLAAAGVALLTARFLPRLPRWSAPVAGAVAMLGVAVAMEYGWYGRTAAALPPQVEVVLTRESRAAWRPWTYVAPYTDGFVALDQGSLRTNAEAETQRMIDIFVFGRWTPPQRVRAIFDCARGRRADLVGGARLTPEGGLEGVRWIETGLDDPVTHAACALS